MADRKFKDTEVGRIPVDWEVKRWNEISDVRDGTHDSPKYYNDGVKFITSKNIVNGKLDLNDVSYISKEDAYVINQRSKVDKGDILMSMIGTIGDAVVVDFEPDFCIKNVALIKPNNTKILSNFMYQTIISNNYQKYIKDNLEGGIQKFISLGALRNLSIPLPPLPEQKAIAQVLSDMDELIESMEKLIHKKKQIKQGTMQELLTGKKRLPGFSGEWTVKKLGDIATITMGQSPSSTYYNTRFEGLPLIQGNADLVNRKTAKRIYTKQITKKCKKGDIILTVRAPVGKVGKATFDACIGRGVCAISYTNDYLYYYLMHIEEYWDKLSKGTTFDSVNSSDIQALLIPLPPLPEQKAIAQILSDMDAEIEALEKKLDKYKKIKEGMMEKLLTGQVRLV